ncbi:MAG: phosphoglycerate kinase [Magnetococcales bacterium]|nr:phosphoglycerate kinase [Magnetococcales bacterium]
MSKMTIRDVDLTGKRVMIRVDFNVPQDENGQIREDTRIRAALPTIRLALAQGAKVILVSHLGRPKGTPDAKYSLKPVQERLAMLLGQPVRLAPDCVGEATAAMVRAMRPGDVLMLENVRFHAAEEKNLPEFARQLAELADVAVNDAFGTAHRAHASNAGIGQFVQPMVAGLLLADEIAYFDKSVRNPERPFAAILGGSKVSSKIGVIEALTAKVDALLIGGGMAFTFLAAMGKPVGSSLVEKGMLDTARQAIAAAQQRGVQLLLPLDVVAALQMDPASPIKTLFLDESIPEHWMGFDIGPVTVQRYIQALKGMKTILWNGPMGVFEMEPFAQGTLQLAQAVADSHALSVVGGGDTDAAVRQAGVAERISFISTGGGAFLELLEKGSLPGIEALTAR